MRCSTRTPPLPLESYRLLRQSDILSGVIWSPTSEDEIRRAAANGLLAETHYLDLKRELPAGDSGNRGLAKDIAAFALDGGTILIGVDEDTTPPSITPVDLAGLPERVEQIAGMRVQEGVVVSTVAIETPPGSGQGVLVVRVPASPRAPHMADGKYYGRGDKTNRPLSHPEVLTLHQRQLAHQQDILAIARDELTKLTPVSGAVPLLVIVAEPLGAPPALLRALSAMTGKWHGEIISMLDEAGMYTHRSFDPNFSATQPARRAGAVAVTVGMPEGTRFESERAAEIQFRESGVLVLGSRRPTIETRRNSYSDPQEYVFETLIVEHTQLFVELAAVVSKRFGFAGSWRFGLVVTGLLGKRSYSSVTQVFRHSDPYSDDEYTGSAVASLEELEAAPMKAVEEIVGSLLRSINCRDVFPELDGD